MALVFRRVALMLFLAALLGSSAAHADSLEIDARHAYERGARFYQNKEFQEAAAAFSYAYQLKPHPAFLYNLALTYRAMNEPAQAITYFEKYLSDLPTAADRANVEAQIAEQKKKLADAEQKNAPPPRETTPPPVTPPPPLTTQTEVGVTTNVEQPTENKHRPVYKTWWFWTITGVAVAAVAVGLGVGLSRSSETYPEVMWR